MRDYLAGLFVVLEDQYGVGDVIDTGAATGTVEWVSLRMTRLRDADGVSWYVPNGEIKRVGNYSQRQPSARQPDDDAATGRRRRRPRWSRRHDGSRRRLRRDEAPADAR